MSHHLRAATFASALLCLSAGAQAASIAGNVANTASSNLYTPVGSVSHQDLATSFVTGNATTLRSIQVLLQATNDPPTPLDPAPPMPTSVNAKICANAPGNIPDDSQCSAALTQLGVLPSVDRDWVTFTGSYSLQGNTRYWIVLSANPPDTVLWFMPSPSTPDGAYRSDGTPSWGGTLSQLFNALDTLPPIAVVGNATGVSLTGATVLGNVNDQGENTTVSFEYGTTTTYGGTANATPASIAAGSGATAVQATLSGLTCGTLYHYRVNGINLLGTTNSADATFTTTTCPPSITTLSTNTGSTVGGTSVTISGANFSGATAVRFGGSTASSFTVNSATSITAMAPAHARGSAPVTVETPSGISPSSAFSYRDNATAAVATATGGGTVSARIESPSSSCEFDLASVSTFIPPAYQGVTPPYGALRFKLTGCTAGETVRVSVSWPSVAGMRVMKYGKTPSSPSTDLYYPPNNISASGNTVSYEITDNGLGDDTFTGADGVINDPVVLVPGGNAIPTLSEWVQWLLMGVIGLAGLAGLGLAPRRQRA